MSEYQYYEFQVVDRPLTHKQMSELRGYSSRAQITATSFVNVYNWESRWFMLRIPNRLLESDIASTYCAGENLWCRASGDHLILSFNSEEEEFHWTEGEGWLPSLLPLRSDLIRGDRRCLYLGWLHGVQRGECDEETFEPPIPPGLRELSEPLHSFAQFLGIDIDLIAAAAEESDVDPAFGLSKDDIGKWVAELPAADKDVVLRRLLEDDDPHIAAELRQRALGEIRGATQSGGEAARSSSRRTVGWLVARAEHIAEDRRRKEARQRARENARRERERAEKRKRYLESLVGKESDLWTEVDQLIATRQPKQYDRAVSLLQDLHELAAVKGKTPEFALRIGRLCSQHAKKTSLVDRLRKAKLVGAEVADSSP